MKISTTTAVAVAALAAAAPLSVHAQRHEDLFSMLQREFERSSALLEEMWDAAVGRFDDSHTTPSDDVRVVVVETLEDQQDVLSGDDKMLACRVAVKRVAEEATVHDEAMELASRLRTNDVVVVNVVDETTCAMLQRPALVAECDRVMVWQKEMEMWLRRGKSDVEICGALQTLEGDGEYQVNAEADPTPLSCKLCKRFVQMVVQAIAQDVQQVQIVRDILGDICDSMAADSMCHTFLKNYDAIVDWLKHGTDPSVVCARVAMCTSEMAQNAVAVPEEKAVSLTTSKSVATAVCEGSHGCCYCVQISSVVGFISKFAPDQLDKVRSVLKFVCDKLSPSSCKCSDAEKNFDKIVELTKAGKHPKEVCQAIGLCTQKENLHEAKLTELVATSAAARKISTALLSFTTPYGVLDDKNCFYCDYFTTLLEIAIQEDEQDMEAIRQYADMICGILGDSNLCHQYVDKLDFVVDALKKGKKPREICVSLKFCTAKKHTPAIAPVAMNAVTVSAIDNCFFCTQLAGLAKVALAQDEEQIDHIRLIADLVCKALPSDNKCHLVMKEFDQIVDSLKKGEAPADICKDLKFCTKAVVPYGFPAADNCLNCEYATLFLEIFQQIDEKDVTTIRTYADIVCGMLGESSQCHQYVDKLDYILDALKKGTGPHDICKALKFCTTKSPLAINAPRVQSNAVVTPAKATVAVKIDNCFFCTQLTALFKVALAQDEEQISQIRTIADLVCDVLPATNKCHEIMKEADHIIDALKKGEEPAVICKELQFCTKAEVLPLPYMKAPVGNNDCAYCDGIATVLDFAIKEKPDQVQQIREAAGIVCDLLPADDKCHDDLKQFDKVVADLKAGKSPRAICVELNLCPKETAKLTPLSAAKLDALDTKSVVTKAEAKSMSVGCLLCEYTAEVISKIYDNQSELRLAKKTLGTMCFALPPTAKCDVITAKFDEIVHLVGDEKKSPSEACHAVGLCDAAFVEPSTPRVEGEVVEEQ